MNTRITFLRLNETPDEQDYAELSQPGDWQLTMVEEDYALKADMTMLALGLLEQNGPLTLAQLCERIGTATHTTVTVHHAAVVALAMLGCEETGLVSRNGDTFV